MLSYLGNTSLVICVSLPGKHVFLVIYFFYTWEIRIPGDMCFPTWEIHIPSDNCSLTWEIHIPSDMCSPTWETHIRSEMRSPTWETHIPSDMCSLPAKHLSLVIYVLLPGNTYP